MKQETNFEIAKMLEKSFYEFRKNMRLAHENGFKVYIYCRQNEPETLRLELKKVIDIFDTYGT